ncbi:MAG: DUF6116 family protein [Acidobacteriota bacterium]
MPHDATLNPGSIVGRLLARLNLRFPVLVGVLAALTLVDVLVPDFIPFADEIGLTLLTVLLSRWKARRAPEAQETPVTPPSRAGRDD